MYDILKFTNSNIDIQWSYQMAQAKAKKVEEVKVEKRTKKSDVVHDNDKSLFRHSMKYAETRIARQNAMREANKSVAKF